MLYTFAEFGSISQCPPVAVAIAKAKKDGKTFSSANQIEFPVVDISDCMGWDSGLVKKELKSLSWSITKHGILKLENFQLIHETVMKIGQSTFQDCINIMLIGAKCIKIVLTADLF